MSDRPAHVIIDDSVGTPHFIFLTEGTTNRQLICKSLFLPLSLGHTGDHIIVVTLLVILPAEPVFPGSSPLNSPVGKFKSWRAIRTISLYEAAPSVHITVEALMRALMCLLLSHITLLLAHALDSDFCPKAELTGKEEGGQHSKQGVGKGRFWRTFQSGYRCRSRRQRSCTMI